jgi:hypothetical protein
LTPADPGYQVQVLTGRIAELESRLTRLEWAHRVSAQRATVQSVPGGAMINVTMTGTASVKAVPYLLGYSPVAGHGGVVVDVGASQLFIPVSAFL